MIYGEHEFSLVSHDSLFVRGRKTMAIDPWEVDGKADIVLVTHGHFDHCSEKDIKKLGALEVVSPESCKAGTKRVSEGDIVRIGEIEAAAVPAYNTNKFRSPGMPFHPRGFGVGYVVKLPDGVVFYHAGDTDFIPEMEGISKIFGKVDIAFLPVSGTYVMTSEEAAEAARAINPEVAVPMHYGKIVGSRDDAEKFRKLLQGSGIRVEILI